jgi:N-acetylglucosaminyldiphosphoundecaprenol N-acetyl-beta-D-mannosaminyltransferase
MVSVLNIPLYDSTLASAVEKVIKICVEEEKTNRCVSTTGAHGLVFSKENKEFANLLRNFFWNLPDGMPGVWVGRLKGARRMERCYGPDFFRDVLIASASTPIKHYFCGGKEGVAEELKIACGKKFNNFNIAGTFTPPFREMSDEELKELAEDINSKHTDIAWIGISTPKQEIFARRLSAFTKIHFVISVGAAFDFHTDRVTQAPKFIQKASLEWFFRLCMEPKRLFGRYSKIVPYFIYYNMIEYVKGEFR